VPFNDVGILSGDRTSCQQIFDANYVSYSGLGTGFLPAQLVEIDSDCAQRRISGGWQWAAFCDIHQESR